MRSSCLAKCLIITFASRVVDSFQNVWQKNASPADQKLLESYLCRFDFECFFEMGRLFREWAQNRPALSEIFPDDGFRSSGFEA